MFEGSTGLKLNMLNLVMLARYAPTAPSTYIEPQPSSRAKENDMNIQNISLKANSYRSIKQNKENIHV